MKTIFLFLLVNDIILAPLFCQSNTIFQIKDSKHRTPIPYAYIKVLHKNILESADEKGLFSLTKVNNYDTVQISQVAYQSVKIPYGQLLKNKTIFLNEVTNQVAEVTISAKDTRKIIDNVIKNNYEAIKSLKFLHCYRHDIVQFRDTLVAEAYADIIVEIKDLMRASHWGIIKPYLQNIIVIKNPNFRDERIPLMNMEASFIPINIFFMGSSNDSEKYVYFSKQESEDSLLILNIIPRLDYDPNKKYVIKNGKCIINKKTGKILRVDTSLSPKMLEINRTEKYRERGAEKYLYHYTFSELFYQNGIPLKVFWDYKYSFLENNPNSLWTNKSEIVFVKELQNPILTESICILKRDTSLVQMKSQFVPDFEIAITKIFK
jgi:hypothetical protein